MARREWCLLLLIVAIACGVGAAQECPLLLPSFREAQSELSLPSALHLYTTPFDTQCTGNISEVEFCYRRGSAADRLFTVVILRPMGNGPFEVIARSDVSADPDMDNCTTDPHIASVERCCTTRRLEPVIDITEGNVYAIDTAASSILLNFADISRPGRILSIPAGVSDTVPAVLSPNNIRVAMVRFIAVGTAAQECPPLGLVGSSFQEADAVVLGASVLYLYTTPFDTQCTGNISEVEFCYQQGDVTGRLFTVVILEEEQTGMRGYTVVARSDVSADPDVDNCRLLVTIHRCCTTRTLDPVVEVSENSVYGIETASTGALLFSFQNIFRPGHDIHLAGVSANLNETVTGGSGSIRNLTLAMVRFIAIDSETATSPPLTSSPPTVMPPPPQPTATFFPTRGDTGTRTQPQSSTSPLVEQGGDFDPVPIGIGVALGLLVAITVVIVAVTVGVMVVQRRRKKDACSAQPSQGEGFTSAIYTASTKSDDIPVVPNEAYAITTTQNVAYRSLQPDDRTVQQTPASDADGSYDYVREQAVVVYEEIETPGRRPRDYDHVL